MQRSMAIEVAQRSTGHLGQRLTTSVTPQPNLRPVLHTSNYSRCLQMAISLHGVIRALLLHLVTQLPTLVVLTTNVTVNRLPIGAQMVTSLDGVQATMKIGRRRA